MRVVLSICLVLHLIVASENSGWARIVAWVGWVFAFGALATAFWPFFSEKWNRSFKWIQNGCTVVATVSIIVSMLLQFMPQGSVGVSVMYGVYTVVFYALALISRREISDASTPELQLFLSVTATCAYSIIGAVTYSYLEDWYIKDALYFIAISLTTIGLGDYSPKSAVGRLLFPIYASVGLICLGATIFGIRQVLMDTLNHQISLELYKRLTAFERSFEFGLNADPVRLLDVLAHENEEVDSEDQQLTWYKELQRAAQRRNESEVPLEIPESPLIPPSPRHRVFSETPQQASRFETVPLVKHESLQQHNNRNQRQRFEPTQSGIVRLHSARTRTVAASIPNPPSEMELDVIVASGIDSILTRQLRYTLGLVLIYYVIFSLVMGLVEGWHWVDAAYFSFGIMTTIGFGDLAPASVWGRHVLVTFLWVGLAVVTLFGSVVAETILHKLHSMIRHH